MITIDYIAGFVDGEGCFNIRKGKPQKIKESIRYVPVIYIMNTNKEILEKIKNFLGYGSVYTKKRIKFNWKRCSVYQIGGTKNVFKFLEIFIDHLIIKKPIAEKILQYKIYFSDGRFYKHGNQFTGVKTLPKNILQKREELYDWCKNFNHRSI